MPRVDEAANGERITKSTFTNTAANYTNRRICDKLWKYPSFGV